MKPQTIKRLYNHWSTMPLMVYCFIGILASMVFIMHGLTDTSDSQSMIIGVILLVTSASAGIYCKFLDERYFSLGESN